MEKQIKAIVVNVNENPKMVEVKNELSTFNQIVGGYIEVVRIPNSPVLMIVNEEGKLQGLEPNLDLPADTIVGNIVFVGVDGEDFASIPDKYVDGVFEFIYSTMRGVRD